MECSRKRFHEEYAWSLELSPFLNCILNTENCSKLKFYCLLVVHFLQIMFQFGQF